MIARPVNEVTAKYNNTKLQTDDGNQLTLFHRH